MTWQAVKLSDIAEIVMGQAPSGSTYNEEKNGYPLIAGAGDFGGGVVHVEKYTTEPTKISQNNDIVMSIRASIGEKVWVAEGYCLGRGVAAIRAKNNVDRNYLWHALSYVEPTLLAKGRGATFLQVNKDDIQNLEVPLPPLAEQRRIAEQLDTADRILRLREQAIDKLDQLAQSLFYQYDSDASTQYKLSDISEIVSGATPKTEIAEYWGDDICWITPRELTDLPDIFVSDTERKITQKGLRSCAASVLPANSVLFSSRAPIGHVAINSLPMATNQGFKSFVVKPDLVEPIYLYYWLKSRKKQLQALGVGATFKEVSKSIVSAIDISLPPISIQREFVARTQTIRALKLNMQKGMKDSSALSLTLQNLAFSMA